LPHTFAAYICRIHLAHTFAAYICRIHYPPIFWKGARGFYHLSKSRCSVSP
jgi:hypothetical protein